MDANKQNGPIAATPTIPTTASFVPAQLAPVNLPPVSDINPAAKMDQIRALGDAPFINNLAAINIALFLQAMRDLYTGAVGDDSTGRSGKKKKKNRHNRYNQSLDVEKNAAKKFMTALMPQLMQYRDELDKKSAKHALMVDMIAVIFRASEAAEILRAISRAAKTPPHSK
jgi:hypothetical protein